MLDSCSRSPRLQLNVHLDHTANRMHRTLRKPRTAVSSNGVPTVVIEPDLDAALDRVLALLPIPGASGNEAAVARFVTEQLLAAGANSDDIRHDKAHTRTPFNGGTGNLIFRLPGTIKAPRRLLMAHMDTVPICVGSKPVRLGEFIRSSDPKTGLGADDRAGVAVVLTAAVEILRRKLPHPPLTFFWPVQEEVGLYGARCADLKMLGGPKLAFNWDGRAVEKVIIGATGGYRMTIDVAGIASHAGVAPEKGAAPSQSRRWRSHRSTAKAGTAWSSAANSAAPAT